MGDQRRRLARQQVPKDALALPLGQRWAVDIDQAHGAGAANRIAGNDPFFPEIFEIAVEPGAMGVVGPRLPMAIFDLRLEMCLDGFWCRLLKGEDVAMPDHDLERIANAKKGKGLSSEVLHFINKGFPWPPNRRLVVRCCGRKLFKFSGW